MGDGNETDPQRVPSNLVFDRCYIHGNPGQNVVRGIGLNSADTIITECYISDFHVQHPSTSGGHDSQAINGYNGPGPYQIVNCYLEGGDENILFGGEDPNIKALVPSDIYFFGNYFSKPLQWRNPPYIPGVKNLFAQRVTVEGNIFENVWSNRDQGAGAIGMGPRNQDGNSPQSTVRDVTFQDNIIRHAGNAITIFVVDDQNPSEPAKNIIVQNNLFYDINGFNWGTTGNQHGSQNGRFVLLEGGAQGFSDITFDHNTCFQVGVEPDALYLTFEENTPHEKIENFTFTNNIATGTCRRSRRKEAG